MKKTKFILYLYKPMNAMLTKEKWIELFASIGVKKKNIVFDKANQTVKIKGR